MVAPVDKSTQLATYTIFFRFMYVSTSVDKNLYLLYYSLWAHSCIVAMFKECLALTGGTKQRTFLLGLAKSFTFVSQCNVT